jgi:hypothetical protein
MRALPLIVPREVTSARRPPARASGQRSVASPLRPPSPIRCLAWSSQTGIRLALSFSVTRLTEAIADGAVACPARDADGRVEVC